MQSIKKLFFLVFFTAVLGHSATSQIISFTPPYDDEPPNIQEIIKKIEDTLSIRQGKVKIEDTKLAEDKLRQVNPDGSVPAPSQIGVDKNSPDRLLIEAQKATETVEKLTETATLELREGLDSVDIFGFDFFRRKEIKLFNNAVDIKPPLNYVLGVGDQIVVSIWGYADYNRLFYIDKDGYIQQENVGRIYLKGLTLEQAKELLRTRFSNSYMIEKSQFDVSINYSRVITINIVGDVENPGSYTFPAINTAYNILTYVGGPSKSGSVRDIQIKRDGKIYQHFDLYKFLFEPENQGDIFLNNNDYIYVPLQKNIVKIVGAVNKPGKYEMLPEETLDDLLKFCGGYTPNAFKTVAQVKRYLENSTVLIDYNLDSLKALGKKMELFNGDEIRIRTIPEPLKNFVEIWGPVRLPGSYELVEGYKVKDIIEKAQGFRDDIYMDEAFITRTNIDDGRKNTYRINLNKVMEDPNSVDNMTLQIRDVIETYSKTYFLDTFSISISGEVRNPRRFVLEKNMTLRDAVMMSGGLTDFAYLDKIIIYRINENLADNVISFKIDTANNYARLDSFKLEKRDKIIVKRDLSKIDKYFVEVNGMVRTPGAVPFHENMTLADAIILSDGFKMEAASNRIEIARIANFDKAIAQSVPTQISILSYSISKNIGNDVVANTVKLQPHDQIYVRPTPEFEYQSKVRISGEVMYPGEYVLISKDEKLSSLVERAGGLTRFAYPDGARLYRRTDQMGNVLMDLTAADSGKTKTVSSGVTGYVLMDLDKAVRRKNSKFNYILNRGDSIYIPQVKDLVALQGAFNYPSAHKPDNLFMPFTQGKHFKYYIKTYGAGFATGAKRIKSYVIYPNGKIQKGRKAAIEKGSTIVIPTKPPKKKKEKVKDTNPEAGYQAMRNINIMVGTIATAVTTTILLMSLIKK
jgi:protein involved in polysaccharide export with SLBB domain